MSTLSVFDLAVPGSTVAGSFGRRNRFESDSWKRVMRRSVWSFSLLFLVACGDDDDDPAPAAMTTTVDEPTARNEGEILVSFTIAEGTGDITMLSGADFQIVAATGMDSTPVTDVSNVVFFLHTRAADGTETEVTDTTTVMAGDVLYLRVTEPNGALTDSELDYTISVANDASVQIGTATVTDFTAGDGMDLATLLTATATDYDTDGPNFAEAAQDDYTTGSGMTVTVTFDQDLHEDSVQATDFTVVDAMDMTVSVTDATLSGMEVVLTLGADWADTHVISLEANAVQDANNVGNPALGPDTDAPTLSDVTVDPDNLDMVTLDYNEAVVAVAMTGLVVTDFTVTDGTTAATISSVTINDAGDVVLTLAADLTVGTAYTVSVSSGVLADAAGNAVTAAGDLTDMVTPTASTAADTDAPTLTATTASTDLLTITLDYDEDVVAVSADGLAVTDFTVTTGTPPVAVTVDSVSIVNGNVELVFAADVLTAGTDYTVTVAADILADAAGNAVTGDDLTDTVTTPGTAVDETAPTLTATTVSSDLLTITLDYDEPVVGDVMADDFTVTAEDDSTVDVDSVSIVGGNVVLVFAAENALTEGTEYTVTVAAGVLADAAGNDVAGSDLSGMVTPADTTAPTLTAVVATTDDTDMVTIDYDDVVEAVDTAMGLEVGDFTVTSGTGDDAVTVTVESVTINDDGDVVLTLASGLEADTEYTVTVEAGVLQNGAGLAVAGAHLTGMVTLTAPPPAPDEDAPEEFTATVGTVLTMVTLNFNEPIAGTVSATDFTVTAGTVTVSVSDAMVVNGDVVLTVATLTDDTEYTVTAAAMAVADASGNAITASLTDTVTPGVEDVAVFSDDNEAPEAAEAVVVGLPGYVVTITLPEEADANTVNADGSDFVVYSAAAATATAMGTVSTAFAATGASVDTEGTGDDAVHMLLVTITPTSDTAAVTTAQDLILGQSATYNISTEAETALLTFEDLVITSAATSDVTAPTLTAVQASGVAQTVKIDVEDPFAAITLSASEELANVSADDFVVTGATGVEVTRAAYTTTGTGATAMHFLLVELGATGTVAAMTYPAAAAADVLLGISEDSDLSDAAGNLVAIATPINIGSAEVETTSPADGEAPTASVATADAAAMTILGDAELTLTLALSEYLEGTFDKDAFGLDDSAGTASTAFEVKSATFVQHEIDAAEATSTVVLVIGATEATTTAGTAVASTMLTLAVGGDDLKDIAGNDLAFVAAMGIVDLAWNTAPHLSFAAEPTDAIALSDLEPHIVTLTAASEDLLGDGVKLAAANFLLVNTGTTTAATNYEVTTVEFGEDDAATTDRDEGLEVYVSIAAKSTVNGAAKAIAAADFDLILATATAAIPKTSTADGGRNFTLVASDDDATENVYDISLSYVLDNDPSLTTASSKLVGLAATVQDDDHYTVTVALETAVKFGAAVASSTTPAAAMTAIDGAFTLVDNDPAGDTASTLFDVNSISLLLGSTAVTAANAAGATRTAATANFDKLVFVLESDNTAGPASAATDVYVKWGDTVFTTVSTTDAPVLASNVLLGEGLRADGTDNEASAVGLAFITGTNANVVAGTDTTLAPQPAAGATVELGIGDEVGAVAVSLDIAFQEELELSDAAVMAGGSAATNAIGAFKLMQRAPGTSGALTAAMDFDFAGGFKFLAMDGSTTVSDADLTEDTAGGGSRDAFLSVEDLVVRSVRSTATDATAVELWLVAAAMDFQGADSVAGTLTDAMASVSILLADSVIADGTNNDVSVTGVEFINTSATTVTTAAADKDIDVRVDGLMGETLMTLTVQFEEVVELGATAVAAGDALGAANAIFTLEDAAAATAMVVPQLEIVSATFNNAAGTALATGTAANELFHGTAGARGEIGSVELVVGAANPYLGHGDLDAADLYIDVNVAALGMASDGAAVTDIKPDNGILVAEDVESAASEVSVTVSTTTANDVTIDAHDSDASPPNQLTVMLDFDNPVELGSAGDSVADPLAAANAIFALQEGTSSSVSANFEFVSAAFSLAGGAALVGGTTAGQLGATAGSDRANFDQIILVVDTPHDSGAATTAADLYLTYLANALSEGDGTAITEAPGQRILLLEDAQAEHSS